MSLNQMFKDDPERDHLISIEYIYDLDDLDDSDELGCLQAIVLNFERQSFTVKAVPEDDTIKIVPGKIKPNSEQKLIPVSEDEPWSTAIGSFIRWSWALINDQGYPDAIQFEFAKEQEDRSTSSITIQLVTIASSISIYELNEIEC